MTSGSDDNPFARKSVWPRMPQVPLRVITRTGQGAPEAAPPPPAFTPLVVRPMPTPPTPGVFAGGGVPPMRQPPAHPPTAPVEAPKLVADPPPEPPEAVAVEPPVPATPPTWTRRKKPRRSPLPAIAAVLVGVAGVIGLAFLLGRRSEPPTAIVAVPTPVVVPVAATPVVPLPPTLATDITPPVPLSARSIPLPARPTRAPVAVLQESDASAATSEALSGTALSLPTAQPVVTYKPPPAADPGAPVVNRDPNA